ncbi:hypothetical protein NW762_002180 [Fusarium torreyae]|uniref:Uncharacterized protein n=1 Tax=Fusarium torreyae TaxID=1237075 RepID=A0A9W8SF77_9HYPO|nr:hypothetical protein NW762_002180 [Fusarium torreyae]
MEGSSIDEDLVQSAGGDPALVEELDRFLPEVESMSSQAANWTIHSQRTCPLFCILPPEIRLAIFGFALSEHDTYFDRHGFGARIYTFSVTWTAQKLEPEDGDDPDIPGPDDLKHSWPELRRDALVSLEKPQVLLHGEGEWINGLSNLPRAWREPRVIGGDR